MPTVIVIGNSRIHLREKLVLSYIEEARRLWQLGRVDEAEAVMREAVKWFPDNADLCFAYANFAEVRQDWKDAAARWHNARLRYPDRWFCYVGEALGFCELERYEEAEELLREAIERFPGELQPVIAYARVALFRRAWEEALTRCRAARSRFPQHSGSYIGEAWALRELGQLDEAEALLRQTMAAFPDEAQAVVDHARVAEARKDWPEAARRWEDARKRAPSDISGFIGGATALRELRRYGDAEDLARKAMANFPPNAQVWSIYADLATRRNDWAEAFRRWQDAEAQFPSEREITHRIHEARLRVLETGSPPEPFADPTAVAASERTTKTLAESEQLTQLMMHFESLGGLPHGCEFGTIQREFGAEPLGLLRWSDIGPEELADALQARFVGVGLPENTELFLAENAGRREYRTKDTRFGMIMHTFVHEDTITYEKMLSQVCRRLQFLVRS